MKNITKSLSLIKTINSAQLSVEDVMSLLSNLGEHCTIEDLQAFVAEQRQLFEDKGLSDEQREKIEQQQLDKLQSVLVAQVSKFRKLEHLKKTYSIETEKKSKAQKGKIYTRQAQIEELMSWMNDFATKFGTSIYFHTKDIHPSIHSKRILLTPDYTIDTVNLAEEIFTHKVGFDVQFLHKSEEGSNVFEHLYTLKSVLPSFFAKNISLLQVFAFFGLDELIEKSVIFGCNVDYKESSTGKTALDFYNPDPDILPNKKAYIISLLDGTYENGKYKAMYQKKKLEETVPEPKTDSTKSYKI